MAGASTALTKYERLESPGLWRASALAQRREVVVSIRAQSLVLTDPRSDMALAHWSLPAVTRAPEVTGGEVAVFRPGAEADEELELSDPEMIEALETVVRTLERRKPHPGRLRGAILAVGGTLALAAAVFWLPDLLIRQSARLLSAPSRAELGQAALDDLLRLTGQPCAEGLGTRAAARLAERMLGPGQGQILILREGMRGAVALPGGIIALSRELVEAPPDAETAAGFILTAGVRRGTETDQVTRLLESAGLTAALRLLVTGTLPDDALSGIGEALVAEAETAPNLPLEELMDHFRHAHLSPAAYAAALTGAPDLARALAEGDPFGGKSPEPVLTGDEWSSLQGICFG